MRNKFFIIFIFLLSGALGLLLSLHLHKKNENSDVQMIQTFHYPALFVKQLEGDPQAGKKIFKEFCATCHAQQPQIDVNAPHVGDEKIWKPLRQLGVPVLLKITIDGVGAMPARGGCFECSDEQLSEAIRYMLSINANISKDLSS